MINVLLLVKRYTGNYALLNEMAKLDSSQFRCVVCYLGGENDGQNPLDRLAKTYYLGLHKSELSIRKSKAARRLAEILDREQIHVLNCHLQRTVAVGVAAARLARSRPKVLATLHGLGSAGSLQRKLGNFFLYRNLHKVVGVSKGVKEDILRNNWFLSPQKVVVIYNGIDTGPYNHCQQKEVLRQELYPEITGKTWLGTVGRLTKVKNQKNLLLAFERTLKAAPESVLLIAGRGESENELKGLASQLGIADKVHFLGFRTDIPQVLASLDIFVLPSLREGFGLALVEAMCTGLPVIASKVGGIPEIFGEADVGTLVEPEDIEGLAGAMIRYCQFSEEELCQLGRCARERVLENFTSTAMIKQYENLYREAFQNIPL